MLIKRGNMKKIFYFFVLAGFLLILAGKFKIHTDFGPRAPMDERTLGKWPLSEMDSLEIHLAAREPFGKDLGPDQRDPFVQVASAVSLRREYADLSISELRERIQELQVSFEKSQLIEKFNSNSLSAAESTELARLVRMNFALHQVLVQKRLEQFKKDHS